MIRNWHDMKARCLKAALMRKLGLDPSRFLQESLEIDPLYMGCLYEKALSEHDMTAWKAVSYTHLDVYKRQSM